MKTNQPRFLFVVVIILAMTLSACNINTLFPSPTPTSTPLPTSTSTPIPTPTSTPVPYDLTIQVTDADGNPIANVTLNLTEFNNNASQVTGADGEIVWQNLPGDTVTLDAMAQGYFPIHETKQIERGQNLVSLILERDPFGILTSEACSPKETLLYLEDFQDKKADSLAGLQTGLPGFQIGTDSAGDIVLVIDQATSSITTLENVKLTNAVWRFRVFYTQATEYGLTLHWLETVDGDYMTYEIFLPAISTFIAPITRFDPGGVFDMGFIETLPSPEIWHLIEISSYNGEIQYWMDGKVIKRFQDPGALSDGTFGIGGTGLLGASELPIYIDDISVCGLSAPFTSLLTPTPTPMP